MRDFFNEILAENGDSCKQKFKLDAFTQPTIMSKALQAAMVEFLSESEFSIIFDFSQSLEHFALYGHDLSLIPEI